MYQCPLKPPFILDGLINVCCFDFAVECESVLRRPLLLEIVSVNVPPSLFLCNLKRGPSVTIMP